MINNYIKDITISNENNYIIVYFNNNVYNLDNDYLNNNNFKLYLKEYNNYEEITIDNKVYELTKYDQDFSGTKLVEVG